MALGPDKPNNIDIRGVTPQAFLRDIQKRLKDKGVAKELTTTLKKRVLEIYNNVNEYPQYNSDHISYKESMNQLAETISIEYTDPNSLWFIPQDFNDLQNIAMGNLSAYNKIFKSDIESAEDWEKHTPYIVSDKDKWVKDGVTKCALNFGIHQCVFQVVPSGKKKARRCKKKNALVGVDMDFYTKLQNNTTQKALESYNRHKFILNEHMTGRQFFCHNHLALLFGVVPRKGHGDDEDFNLYSVANIPAGTIIAKFSNFVMKQDEYKNEEEENEEIEEIEKNEENIPLISGQTFIKIFDNNYFNDKCYRDLADYISDPRKKRIFYGQNLQDYEYELTQEEEALINVEIIEHTTDDDSFADYYLQTTKNIYAGLGIENEVQLFLDFGEDYWQHYVTNEIKIKKLHEVLDPEQGFVSNPNKKDIKAIKTSLLSKLAAYPGRINQYFEADAQKLKKMNKKRLYSLESLM